MTSLAPSVRRTRGMSSGYGTFFVQLQVQTQIQIGLLAHILITFVTAPLMRSLVGMWNRAGLASPLNLPLFGVSSSGFLRSSCGSGFLTSEGFLTRKVYLVVAGSLLVTSIIAGIFLLGLRDTVSLTSSTSPHLVLQIRANPKGWFIFAMVLQIPIFGIVLAISCCNEKVEKKKE